MLDASTRVAAAAGSGLIDLHLHCVVDHPDETDWLGCINCAHDLACITWICDAEQLYTGAALVLDASTRVAAKTVHLLYCAGSKQKTRKGPRKGPRKGTNRS